MKRKFLISLLLLLLSSSTNFNYPAYAADEIPFKKVQIENPTILKEQAIISYKKGSYKEALNFLENIDPYNRDEQILLLMANSCDSLGDSEKASDYISRAIAISPKSSFAYYNLGILNYNKGEVNKALDCFNKAIKYNKSFSPAYYNAGNC